MPTSNFLATVNAAERSEVKIAEDKPAGWEFASSIACGMEVEVINVSKGEKDSDR